MKSIIRPLAYLILLIAVSSVDLVAQIPRTFSLQGVLTDAAGTPLSDGTHQIRVTLYSQSAGGSGLYAEIQPATVKDGVFSIVVGSVTPIPGTMSFDRQYYAGISVDGGPDLSPRTPLTAVPYALNAERAEEATALAPGATGVVTTVNGVDGAVTLVGGGSTTVTRSGQSILITSAGGGSTGIAGVQNTDGTIAVTNPNGPVATIGVATGGITATLISDGSVISQKLADGAVTSAKLMDGSVTESKLASASVTGAKIARATISLDKLSDAGAAAGQVPTYNGGAIAWTTPQAGGGLTLPHTTTLNTTTALDITNTGGSVIRAVATGASPAIFAESGKPMLGIGIHGRSRDWAGIHGSSESGMGVYGFSESNIGVWGLCRDGKGVLGFSNKGVGVYGEGTDNAGVEGVGNNGPGLKGLSDNRAGVVGTIEKNWSRNNVGVLGFSPSGEGVCGESESGIGVRGWSQNSNAIVGISSKGDALNTTCSGSGKAISAKHTGTGHAVVVDQDGSGWGIMVTAKGGAGAYVSSESGTGVTAISLSNTGLEAVSSSGDIMRGSQIQGISTNIRFRVTNAGNVRCDGAFTGGGADLAEAFDFEGNKTEYEPGDVLIISADSDARITRSNAPYSHMVIGVYATKPGVLLAHTDAESEISDLIPVGVVGVIPTKVCTENGPIHRGDLLTTSSTAGAAMKVHPVITNGIPSFPSGIILGKALENYNGQGTGVIRVFVNSK
jgi:hypothetical protein